MTEQQNSRKKPRAKWWVIVAVGLVVLAVIVWLLVTGAVGEEPEVSSGAASGDATATAEGAGTSGAASPSASTAQGDEEELPSPGADEVQPSPGATAPITKPPTRTEVPFEETGTVADTLVVEILSVEGVTAGRDIPGEVKGPAVRVKVRVSNDGQSAVDTSGASVTLTYGDDDRIPAVELSDPGASVFPGRIEPSTTGEAVYYFAVPLENAGNVRIVVDVLASEPNVVFSGPRPR